MVTQPPCSLCRSPIDYAGEDAIVLQVQRLVDSPWPDNEEDLGGSLDTFWFCDQEHAASYLTRFRLPPPVVLEDPDGGGPLEALGCLALLLVSAALVLGAGYGFVALVLRTF